MQVSQKVDTLYMYFYADISERYIEREGGYFNAGISERKWYIVI